jgi:hypothetical protein
MATLADLIGLPVDQLFQGLLLPVLIVFAILWALLNSVRVFDRKINLVLALALTIMSAMTPQFTIFTTYVAQLGAQVAIVAFFLLFAFGSLMWAFGRGRDIYYDFGSAGGKRNHLVKRIADYKKKSREAADRGDTEEVDEWEEKAERARRQLNALDHT